MRCNRDHLILTLRETDCIRIFFSSFVFFNVKKKIIKLVKVKVESPCWDRTVDSATTANQNSQKRRRDKTEINTLV